MKATWIVHNLGSEKNINRLCYSIQEAGRDVKFLSLKEAAEAQETLNEECLPIVVTGSIYYNGMWKKMRPNWIGNWHSRDAFKCSSYYAYWGKYIVQDNYIMLPWKEISRRKEYLYKHFGNGTPQIFIRPDSGEKEFIGQIVEESRFHKGFDDYYLQEISPDLLCVVSSPQKITKELRLIIANKKVITGSTYYIEKHNIQEPLEEQPDKDHIVDFANMILNDNSPPNLPPVHCLDVALIKGQWKLMEIGCFCCCGMYEADRVKIALEVSEVTEQEYQKAVNQKIQEINEPINSM